MATQFWFLSHQSAVCLALYRGSGELLTHARARRVALLWGPLLLLLRAGRDTGLAPDGLPLLTATGGRVPPEIPEAQDGREHSRRRARPG